MRLRRDDKTKYHISCIGRQSDGMSHSSLYIAQQMAQQMNLKKVKK